MNLEPLKQTKLYGLNSEIKELFYLFENNKLPKQIMLSGPKGIGKCTMSYHLINFVLSVNEENPYDAKNLIINENNKSFRLIKNSINPNFYSIDVIDEKKKIDINQIRNLIIDLNKSSFNHKPRFVLIDNVELLSISSINALLKIIEEPNNNIFFILINNNKKMLPTLKSRCLNFRISLSHKKVIDISNELLDLDVRNIINKSLMNYYLTPGKILNLIRISKEYELDLKSLNLRTFLKNVIKKKIYRNDIMANNIMYDFIEFALTESIDLYSNFINKIHSLKKFNLDEEIFLIEFENKFLNG